MLSITIIGWSFVAAAAVCAVVMNLTDRSLQKYRLPGKPATSYLFLPIRDRASLYRPEGHYLVRRFWLLLGGMYGLGLVGMAFIGFAYVFP